MIKHQNTIVIALIIALFVFGVAPLYGVEGAFEYLALFSLILIPVIGWMFLRNRSPKLKRTVGWVMAVGFVGIVLIGLVWLILQTLRGETPLGGMLIVVIPIVAFIILTVMILYWGTFLWYMGKPSIAEQHYTNLLRLWPRFWFAYEQRASLKQQRGEFAGALADYQQALQFAEVDPANSKILIFTFSFNAALFHSNVSSLYFRQGAFEDCIRECDAGLAHSPLEKVVESILRFNRGLAYLNLEQFESALSDLNALATDMDDRFKQSFELSVTAHSAVALCGLGREAEARDLWTELTARESRYRDMTWVTEQFKWPEALVNLAQRLMS